MLLFSCGRLQVNQLKAFQLRKVWADKTNLMFLQFFK